MSNREECLTYFGLCLLSLGLFPAVFAAIGTVMVAIDTVEILIWGEDCPGTWEATVGHKWAEVRDMLKMSAWGWFCALISFVIMCGGCECVSMIVGRS